MTEQNTTPQPKDDFSQLKPGKFSIYLQNSEGNWEGDASAWCWVRKISDMQFHEVWVVVEDAHDPHPAWPYPGTNEDDTPVKFVVDEQGDPFPTTCTHNPTHWVGSTATLQQLQACIHALVATAENVPTGNLKSWRHEINS